MKIINQNILKFCDNLNKVAEETWGESGYMWLTPFLSEQWKVEHPDKPFPSDNDFIYIWTQKEKHMESIVDVANKFLKEINGVKIEVCCFVGETANMHVGQIIIKQ